MGSEKLLWTHICTKEHAG